MLTSVCYCCRSTDHYANKCNIRPTAFCTFCKAQGHLLRACKRKTNDGGGSFGELGDLGVRQLLSKNALLVISTIIHISEFKNRKRTRCVKDMN